MLICQAIESFNIWTSSELTVTSIYDEVFKELKNNMIRFLTAGESHGPELTGIIEGVPQDSQLVKSL